MRCLVHRYDILHRAIILQLMRRRKTVPAAGHHDLQRFPHVLLDVPRVTVYHDFGC